MRVFGFVFGGFILFVCFPGEIHGEARASVFLTTKCGEGTQRLTEFDPSHCSVLSTFINVDSSKAGLSQDDEHFREDLGSLNKHKVTQFLQTSAPTLQEGWVLEEEEWFP